MQPTTPKSLEQALNEAENNNIKLSEIGTNEGLLHGRTYYLAFDSQKGWSVDRFDPAKLLFSYLGASKNSRWDHVKEHLKTASVPDRFRDFLPNKIQEVLPRMEGVSRRISQETLKPKPTAVPTAAGKLEMDPAYIRRTLELTPAKNGSIQKRLEVIRFRADDLSLPSFWIGMNNVTSEDEVLPYLTKMCQDLGYGEYLGLADAVTRLDDLAGKAGGREDIESPIKALKDVMTPPDGATWTVEMFDLVRGNPILDHFTELANKIMTLKPEDPLDKLAADLKQIREQYVPEVGGPPVGPAEFLDHLRALSAKTSNKYIQKRLEALLHFEPNHPRIQGDWREAIPLLQVQSEEQLLKNLTLLCDHLAMGGSTQMSDSRMKLEELAEKVKGNREGEASIKALQDFMNPPNSRWDSRMFTQIVELKPEDPVDKLVVALKAIREQYVTADK